jgi:uroporphyrinogen-III synthase
MGEPARMTLGPLAGFTVAVTADRRAEEQTTLLTRLGASVLHGPVIRTRPLDGADGVRAATESVIARPPEVVVLITALGVRGWFNAADSLGLGDRLLTALTGPTSAGGPAPVVLARGPKAAGAALSHGLDVSWQAPGARSAGVLDELRRRHLHPLDPGTRVAVQLDGSPFTDLADEVARCAPGLDVVAVPVYRWELPEDPMPAHRLITAVADGSVDAVTFTSSHSVANFVALAEQIGAVDAVREAFGRGDTVPVAVGPVTADRLEAFGLGPSRRPRTFRLGAMVQALVEVLRDRGVDLCLTGTDVRVQGRLVVVSGEEPVQLTDRERAVLSVLSRRPGAVVSKGELRQQVWGNGADDHAVEVTVGRLRRRLGPASNGIETVMRRGYRLAVS